MIDQLKELQQPNALMEVYKEQYKARYGFAPILLDFNAQNTILKDIIRVIGFERARKLLVKFFKMDGDRKAGDPRGWFEIQAHSLKCFKTSLEQVNAACGIEERNIATLSHGANLVIDSMCVACDSWYKLTCHSSEIEKRAHFEVCPSCSLLYTDAAIQELIGLQLQAQRVDTKKSLSSLTHRHKSRTDSFLGIDEKPVGVDPY